MIIRRIIRIKEDNQEEQDKREREIYGGQLRPVFIGWRYHVLSNDDSSPALAIRQQRFANSDSPWNPLPARLRSRAFVREPCLALGGSLGGSTFRYLCPTTLPATPTHLL